MAGTDLDAGEVKLYATTKPHVIILEGAMNDLPDADGINYIGQFTRLFPESYRKTATGSVTTGDTWSKTPMAEVNRTTFGGAYRYLVEELSTLFPQAQIFITTVSRLGYWHTDVNTIRSKVAAQQRVCAELCGASVIDWSAEGNINTINNYPLGSGTQADPFIYDKTVGNKDTNDAMHPNGNGGIKLGRLAGRVVVQKNLGLS
jgi:hypothetical protein